MAKRLPVQLDWFNVSYSSLVRIGLVAVVLAAAGGTYWYQIGVKAPKENARAAIADAVTQITEQLEVALSTSPELQPELFDQLLQRIAALRWLAMQAELGFYPQRRAAEVGEQLRIAQSELSTHGTTAALPISYQSDVVPPRYRIDSSR